jgi:nucleotide-binding universal stress UspA family protein
LFGARFGWRLRVSAARRCFVFRSIVVPLDLEEIGDRALPIATSLAELGGLPVELLTISSPRMEGFVDACELDRRVRTHELGAHSIHVLYDDDAGSAVTKFVAGRDDALVVMGSSAKGAPRELAFGSVSEHVLANAHRPVVIVGPHVDPSPWRDAPVLVVAVDESDAADGALPVIESWHRTFGTEAVQVVEVAPVAVSVGATLPEDHESVRVVRGEPDRATRFARRLTDRGVVATSRVLHGGDPAARLADLKVDHAVLVATSARWTATGVHWHSTTRELAQHSRHPVLVVPAV